MAMTCCFSVELPGIEPDDLPGLLPSELPVRSVSFRFGPLRYLRFRFRALTPSRAATNRMCSPHSCPPFPTPHREVPGCLLFPCEFGADDRGDVVAVSRWVKCEGDAVDIASEREGRGIVVDDR